MVVTFTVQSKRVSPLAERVNSIDTYSIPLTYLGVDYLTYYFLS